MTGKAMIRIKKEYQIWEAASKDDNRPCLTGVLCDPRSEKAVAADGFILAAVPAAFDNLSQAALIPATFVKAVSKLAKRDSHVTIMVEEIDGEMWATSLDGTLRSTLINATFPNWEPLMPDTLAYNGPPAFTFNVTLTARLVKAIGGESGSVQMRYTGDGDGASSPVIVTTPFDSESVGIQMPVFSPIAEKPNARIKLAA